MTDGLEQAIEMARRARHAQQAINALGAGPPPAMTDTPATTPATSQHALREAAWQTYYDEMTGEQGLGYLADCKDDLEDGFKAGWDFAPLSVAMPNLDYDAGYAAGVAAERQRIRSAVTGRAERCRQIACCDLHYAAADAYEQIADLLDGGGQDTP